MATFLDIAFLEHFSSIFVVIFVFTAVYAILTFKKPLGDNKGINALIAFAVSVLFIMSKDAIAIIRTAVPWWTLMVLVITFIIIGVEAFGSSFDPGTLQSFSTWILIIAIIIFVFAWAGVAGQKAGPYLGNESSTQAAENYGGSGNVASGNFQENLGATLFHPKVLGVILILVIALFAILFITWPIGLNSIGP
ncbi:hypothetical protein GF327_03290 [Candidatus Woesearchaeota archaeon]|nr:hypothetical protein [Candidatus Woesearchaeota archaeon]